MPKFRKKPVVINAWQWNGDLEQVADVLCGEITLGLIDHTLKIETLEGVMTASLGDWIIRGVKGELYPCKPDIFAATYEPVE